MQVPVYNVSGEVVGNIDLNDVKLTTTASVEFGLREIGTHSTHGAIISSMSGIINDCARRFPPFGR